MDKALAIYGYILKEYLSECFANQQNIDPIALNKERYRAKALFIAICFFKKYNPQHNEIDTSATANAWLKEFFAEGNFFSSLIDSTNQNLKELINESFENFIEGPLLDIATLYESLLSVETGNENAGTEITNGKNYKNKLGSYYTPSLFARSVTEKTIDSFFQLNFDVSFKENPKNISLNKAIVKEISKVTFVDFSCGGGNFITEIIYYFENLFNGIDISPLERRSLLRAVALNISAYDVDVIALEVAKLNLLLQINEPKLYEVLQANFTHANFLLHTDTAISAITKTDVFSSGYIYHENLSLNTDNLKRYDIIVGNPPWEKIRFEEKKFYALYTTAIANNHFKSTRASEIKATEKVHLNLAEFSRRFKSEIEKSKLALKKSGFFSLSNKGELNTYALFTEAAVKLRTERGVVGLVLKSGLVTSQVNQKLFQFLTGEHLVLAIYDFINRKKIFAIDSRERFCFLLLGDAKSNKFKVSMNLTAIDQLDEKENEIELSYDSLRLLNPQTAMLPNFSTKEEIDFLLRTSRDFHFFKDIYQTVRFGRIVHLTSHSDYITTSKTKDNIAIYEGKFFNQFDGKFSGFNGIPNELRYGSKSSSVALTASEKDNQNYFPESRFFINEDKWQHLSKNHQQDYMLAWRSLTSATNTRTSIATILPFIPALQSVQFLTTREDDLLYLAGLFNCAVFDFILKKKLNGIDLTQSIINQIPVPDNNDINKRIVFNGKGATLKQHIGILVSFLLKNDTRLNKLFENFAFKNYDNSKNRFEVIRDIDLLFMFLYKVNDSELKLIIMEFNKQYDNEDLKWFENKLQILFRDNSISSSVSVSTFSPIS